MANCIITIIKCFLTILLSPVFFFLCSASPRVLQIENYHFVRLIHALWMQIWYSSNKFFFRSVFLMLFFNAIIILPRVKIRWLFQIWDHLLIFFSFGNFIFGNEILSLFYHFLYFCVEILLDFFHLGVFLDLRKPF